MAAEKPRGFRNDEDEPTSSGTPASVDLDDDDPWDDLGHQTRIWDAFPRRDEEPEPEPEDGDFLWPDVDDHEQGVPFPEIFAQLVG